MNLTAYGNLKSRKYGNVISFHYTTIIFYFSLQLAWVGFC